MATKSWCLFQTEKPRWDLDVPGSAMRRIDAGCSGPISMNRRDFLALLASAPMAALAPLSTILSQRDWYLDPNIVRHPVGCSAPGLAMRFVQQWDYRDAPHVDYETVRRYEHSVSLPRTE